MADTSSRTLAPTVRQRLDQLHADAEMEFGAAGSAGGEALVDAASLMALTEVARLAWRDRRHPMDGGSPLMWRALDYLRSALEADPSYDRDKFREQVAERRGTDV